jgi:hypothetical protein
MRIVFLGTLTLNYIFSCDIIVCVVKERLRGLVRKRTIPTERPPLVGEVSANFSG